MQEQNNIWHANRVAEGKNKHKVEKNKQDLNIF